MTELQNYFPISTTEKQKILAKYNKTESDVEVDVTILKTWIQKQLHLPKVEDDLLFELFLLRNKFQVEKTKEKVDKYFSIKNIYSDIFENLDPCNENIILATKYFHVAIMPKLTPELRRLIYIQLKLENKNDYNYAALTYVFIMTMETQVIMDYIDSLEVVVESSDFTMALLTKVDASMMTKTVKLFFDAFSGRIGGLHILNASQAMEILVSMCKPLLPTKLQNKMQIHSESVNIFNFIPKDCLPPEIGGTGPSAIKISGEFVNSLRESKSYIIKRNLLASNEKLRIGKQPNQNNIFGMEGTFKKINID